MQEAVNTGNTIYEGTKQVKAVPMTRGAYNAYRGWAAPENEDPADDGYLVEYIDGGKPNDERHAGYISWSPAEIFERTYKPGAGSDFRQRLLHEKAELDGRLEKLNELFESGRHAKLPDQQVGLLNTQRYLMGRLSETLGDRIRAL